jgi:HK97 family phage prohead protease
MREWMKNIPFELKELSDSGEFVGLASTYGNVDLGNDVMDQGAFTKTIAERGGKVRLMDGHKVRIGLAWVRDTPAGLEAAGKINLGTQAGREAYSDLKFYQDNGMPMGMSIGFRTIKADPPYLTKDGARHLKEVSLWEVTVTEFPMNENTSILNVKSISDLVESIKERRKEETKDDFQTVLEEIQLWCARGQMIQALCCSLDDIASDPTTTPDDKLTASRESIQQFDEAYAAMLPQYLAMASPGTDTEMMSMPAIPELKAGRMISATNRATIQKIVESLNALLSEEAGVADAATTSEKEAATVQPEPVVDHSAAQSLIDSMRSLLQ